MYIMIQILSSNSNYILFESPLHLAVSSVHLEKSQMKTVNPENDFLEPPLHSAVGSGHLEKSQKKNPE